MKPKLLFLIESLSGGGAEKVLSVLLKHIDKTKFDITLCTIVDTGIYAAEVRKYVNYTSVLGNPQKKGLLGKILYKILYLLIYRILPSQLIYTLFIPKGNDIEIAFVEGFCTKILSHSTNKKAQKIAWVHTDLINNHWITSVYKNEEEEKQSYQKYDKIIGVSNTATNAINRLYSINNAITLYNPIENDNIIKRANEFISLPPKTQSIRIVTVGRFVPQKAYDRLLRVINRLYENGYPIELWILGDGEQRPILEEYIHTHSLNEIVTLWGFQKNPYPYLKHSDIFVCSSVSEGYSTAVTEALILELPVITTACSGMDELLLNGKCGLITENSESGLYEGIKHVLDNTNLLASYKQNILKHQERFLLSNQMTQIENLFKS
ncbi:glycosyltransferase [Phocaeicola sp. HCN-6420]|uniref:glycosyltransferase n=1 Tax=Phocaeicola sp. HCN-6420 TaxID=3134673 RepID=UPI0030BAFC8B